MHFSENGSSDQRVGSNPTHENEDEADDQDDANDADAAKPPSRKMMRMITRISPSDIRYLRGVCSWWKQ
jgi:hypothetical protein